MTQQMLLAVNPFDARSLIEAFGIAGIAVILFAETGLLVGFFLPGDSLLFTAGILCSTGTRSALHLSLPWTLLAAAAGALLGAQVGYLIGRRAGPVLLERGRRRHIRNAITRSQTLFQRYGYGKAIVLARFIPVVRTVLNPLAGVIGVPARTFTIWQVAGGLLWSVGVTLAGFFLGQHVKNVDHYLLPIIAVIIVVSLLPLLAEVIRARRASAR
ncbi:MAG: DedA family protein [Actinomycetota bacterium]|nr:DedA family protein [Actinomycetota bacterium]